MATEINIEDRRAKLAEHISQKGFVSLAEIVQELGVSESTIRRDLEVLEDQSLLRRTHGGAVSIGDTATHRMAFADRETASVPEKRAIAQAVARLIPDDQTVIFDGGTTCMEVARAVAGRRLNVITNSVPIASLLSVETATEVTMIGGYVYPRTGVALGAAAEEMLGTLHATQLLLSCAGCNPEGVFNANQMMVDVERKMMAQAEEVILVVDHSKFGRRAVTKLSGWDQIDIIVTDAGVDPETRGWLSSLNTRVIYAE
jgi:DeoR/GlpR family transcriptional regulator of sugar metabolism